MASTSSLIAEQQPVFVYGALRSGTTVLRLMLDSHGEVRNPGEVDFLFDHLARDTTHDTGYRYRLPELHADRIFQGMQFTAVPGMDGLDLLAALLDQLQARTPGVLTLNLHRHIDRAVSTLPSARFIHIVRDPRDVARSSIGMGWAGTLYHGVEHWIATEQVWDEVQGRIDQSRILELRFEALIRNTESELRRVCVFLGVPYHPGMLRYQVATSYDAPDATLIEQWRRKSTPADISLVEGRVGEMMMQRGYATVGPGHVPSGMQRMRLATLNKALVWRFGIDRYGTRVYLGEKVSRWVGWTSVNRRLRREMDDLSRAFLR